MSNTEKKSLADFHELFEKAIAATGQPKEYRHRGHYWRAGMKRFSAAETASKIEGALFVDDMLSRMSPSKVAEEITAFLEKRGLSHKFYAGATKRSVRFSVNQGTTQKPHWVGLTRGQARDDLAEIGVVI